MTITTRRKATTYVEEQDKPRKLSTAEWRKLTRLFNAGTHSSKPRRLFAVRFNARGSRHYIALTERLDDAVSVYAATSVPLKLLAHGAVLPDGVKLISPRPICDADWETLARHSCYLDGMCRPRAEWGKELAASSRGAFFDGGPVVGDIFVLTDCYAAGVDVFVRRPGKAPKLVTNLLE